MKMKLLTLLPVIVMLQSCVPDEVSKSGARRSDVVSIPLDSKGQTSEQRNINMRIQVTNQIGKIMWIHLIDQNGKLVTRFPVKNKVTSSGKRLEPSVYQGTTTAIGDERMQPDGTFGSSGDYIFWFDPLGRYHQVGAAGMNSYLITDYPIDLNDPIDTMTGLYKVNTMARQWAEKEEKKNN